CPLAREAFALAQPHDEPRRQGPVRLVPGALAHQPGANPICPSNGPGPGRTGGGVDGDAIDPLIRSAPGGPSYLAGRLHRVVAVVPALIPDVEDALRANLRLGVDVPDVVTALHAEHHEIVCPGPHQASPIPGVIRVHPVVGVVAADEDVAALGVEHL